MTLILLGRRISSFYNYGQALGIICGCISRCAEVKKLYASAFRNENIIRRDVTVNNSVFMHNRESFEDRRHYCKSLGIRARTVIFDIGGESLSLKILHYNVSGIVFRKGIVYSDDSVHRIKLCKPLSLLDKAVQAGREKLSALFVIDADLSLSRISCCKFRRQIFLYCHLCVQHGVPTDIGYAEASEADYFSYNIFLMQDRFRLHVLRLRRLCSPHIAAMRAHVVLVVVCFHT